MPPNLFMLLLWFLMGFHVACTDMGAGQATSNSLCMRQDDADPLVIHFGTGTTCSAPVTVKEVFVSNNSTHQVVWRLVGRTPENRRVMSSVRLGDPFDRYEVVGAWASPAAGDQTGWDVTVVTTSDITSGTFVLAPRAR